MNELGGNYTILQSHLAAWEAAHHTVVWIGVDEIQGLGIADTLKALLSCSRRTLRKLGLEVVMLTGTLTHKLPERN